MDWEFPEIDGGERITLSASTYVAWKKCPESANARLQGIYGPDSKPAFTGILAHRIFARHLNSGVIPDESFSQACREEIGNSTLNSKMGPLGLKPSTLAGVIEEVRGLYGRFVKIPGEGFVGAEVDLAHETASEVRLVGKVDAVYRQDLGGHRLVDWKTGDLYEVEDQLAFYSAVWALERGEIPALVEAISVRTAERIEAVPSSEDVRQVLADLGSLATQVRRAWSTGEGMERRGGPWCRFCPILENCEEGIATGALLN